MIGKIILNLKNDSVKRAFVFALISIFINLAYAVYNGILGIFYESVWHASIFGYYVLLMLMKTVLIIGEQRVKTEDKKKNIIIGVTYVLLLITSIAMIAPSVLMIQNKRTYNLGLIPAITTASYTTYALTMAIININKAKKIDNTFKKQNRLIGLVSSLMSVLVLQNTLINANDGFTEGLQTLSIYTTIGIIGLILFIIIYSYIKNIKKLAR